MAAPPYLPTALCLWRRRKEQREKEFTPAISPPKTSFGRELQTYLTPGDAVLFKGSRGMAMETLVEKVIAHDEGGEE